MATRELHLELLLGRAVIDAAGERVGRIEEVRAEQQADEWVITEYLVGLAAIAERLSAQRLIARFLPWFQQPNGRIGYCIPWDKLDLSDPEHPRLTCTIKELQGIDRSIDRSSEANE